MRAFADVEALVFDVFGTVVDWRSGIAREAAPFLAATRRAPTRPRSPTRGGGGIRRRWRKCAPENAPSCGSTSCIARTLSPSLPEFGIDPAAVPPSELDALNLAWHKLDPWPDSVPGLTRLKRRFIIAPLSNGNIRLMLDMAKRAALPWDAILGAEIAQAYKPAPEAYLRNAEALMLSPIRVCLVAAHNDDLAAARRCGLSTVFIPRSTEHGPGQTTDLEPEENWDVVANGMEDLATRLGL